jgi:hypothetical protein
MTGLIGVLAPGGVLVLTTRGPGFPVHGHPSDYWRFPVASMRRILEAATLDVVVCVPDDDPASPGVFAKAVKPPGWEWPLATTREWDRIDVQEVTG